MKKVINDVLENLAKRRPLFWSEADFQFEFAWELHKKLGEEANIYLERRHEINSASSDSANEKATQSTINKNLDKLYVDIWIEYEKVTYPIELKYTTKRCKVDDAKNQVKTKEQSARDIGCYRFLWDIKRLEEIKTSLSPKEVKGYAIMLTSDAGYYEERKPKQPTLFDDFRLTHNRKIKKDTELKWNLSRIAEDKRADHWSRNWPKFTLKAEYILQWQDFKPIQTKPVDDKGNIVTLKYLLVEV